MIIKNIPKPEKDICPICKQPLNFPEGYMNALPDYQTLAHKDCLYSASILGLQLIYKIFIMFNEKKPLSDIIPYFLKLDKLELRKEDSEQYEDLSSEDEKVLLGQLRASYREHLKTVKTHLDEFFQESEK